MLYDYMNMIESIGLDLLFASIFFLIGMAIKDVLKAGNVPPLVVALYGWFYSLVVLDLSPKALFRLAGKVAVSADINRAHNRN